MDVFLEKINQLLPILGVELLIPAAGTAARDIEREVFLCEIKSLKARGRLIPNGFVVLNGSQAVLLDRASSEKYQWPRNMRLKLKEEGVLAEQKDRLVFTQDAEFSSPSAAAAVVQGGHANGPIAWKNPEGKTLKEIESEAKHSYGTPATV